VTVIGHQSTDWASNVPIEVAAHVSLGLSWTYFRTATGSLTSPHYAWVFGDGATVADDGSPSHTWENPGLYRVQLTITAAGAPTEVYERTLVVGLQASLIPTLATIAEVSFEAVVLVRLQKPDGTTVLTLIPLLAASKPYVLSPAVTSTGIQPDTDAVLDLAGRLQSVYAHRALMLPVPEPDALPDGLYLLFPRDVVYAGTSSALATLQQELRRDWRRIDLEESLYDLRTWAAAEAVRTRTAGMAYTVAGTAAALPAVIEPSMGATWLAPGLGGFDYAAALADAAAKDTTSGNLTLAASQSTMRPLQDPPRQQALRWLAAVGSGLCSVVRRFGETRALRYAEGPIDYPASLFQWNAADGSLTWGVIGQSFAQDGTTPVQNYWAYGACTFGLSREDAEARVPDLDNLNLACTSGHRRLLGDQAVRAMVGDDRELGDHVVVQDGRTVGVRMRTGEVFLPSGANNTTVAGGVHVVSRFWAGRPVSQVTADVPVLRIPSMAEAMTGDVPEVDQVLVGRVGSVSTFHSGMALDTASLVNRYRVRRGGELRTADRGSATVLTGTLGPTALSQLDRTTDEVAPLRNPLRNVTGGGGCSGGCGG
jgi:PKD repeat protein